MNPKDQGPILGAAGAPLTEELTNTELEEASTLSSMISPYQTKEKQGGSSDYGSRIEYW